MTPPAARGCGDPGCPGCTPPLSPAGQADELIAESAAELALGRAARAEGAWTVAEAHELRSMRLSLAAMAITLRMTLQPERQSWHP